MKEKYGVTTTFQKFHHLIQNQFQKSIKILHRDNEKEYINNQLAHYLSNIGIHHQTTCINTPQQNGIAERKNRHLLEVAKSLVFTMNVPNTFWGEAILTATYLIKRMPTKALNFKTPRETVLKVFSHNCLLSNLHFKVFGCTVFAHIPQNHKLDPKAEKSIFLGYSFSQKGYKCYSPSVKKHSVNRCYFL